MKINFSTRKLEVRTIHSICLNLTTKFYVLNAFVECRQRSIMWTFSQISRSYATDFSAKVNNPLNWPYELVINNISPLVNLPSIELLKINDLTKQWKMKWKCWRYAIFVYVKEIQKLILSHLIFWFYYLNVKLEFHSLELGPLES